MNTILWKTANLPITAELGHLLNFDFCTADLYTRPTSENAAEFSLAFPARQSVLAGVW